MRPKFLSITGEALVPTQSYGSRRISITMEFGDHVMDISADEVAKAGRCVYTGLMAEVATMDNSNTNVRTWIDANKP